MKRTIEIFAYPYGKLLVLQSKKGEKLMTRKRKWLIACSFFLLFLNGVGFFAVHYLCR
ncbi:hypothetical protein QNK12_27115 [Neobacillus cucumis]|nr:hypothetical protein QNK12_27115 [Neobacillus cucumis]